MKDVCFCWLFVLIYILVPCISYISDLDFSGYFTSISKGHLFNDCVKISNLVYANPVQLKIKFSFRQWHETKISITKSLKNIHLILFISDQRRTHAKYYQISNNIIKQKKQWMLIISMSYTLHTLPLQIAYEIY